MGTRADVVGTLYEEHHRELLTALSSRIGDPELARDCLQDSFVKLMSRPDVAGGNSPGGWLFTVANNSAKRQRHRDRHLAWGDAPDGDDDDSANDPEAALFEPMQYAPVGECMGELSDRDRNLINDRYFDKLDHATMARKYGLTEGSLSNALSRALARLRTAADRLGFRDPETGRALGLVPVPAWLLRLRATIRPDLFAPAAAGALATTLAAVGSIAWLAGGHPPPLSMTSPSRYALHPTVVEHGPVEQADDEAVDPAADRIVRAGASGRNEGDVIVHAGPRTITRGGDPMEAPTFVVSTPVGGVESDDVPTPPEPVPSICVQGNGWC